MAHKTAQELSYVLLGSDGSQGIIQDPSYTFADCLALFNRCMVEVAGRFYLPDLETDDTITTEATGTDSYVSLPADFHRHLFRCYSTTQDRPRKVYGSLALLHRALGYVDRSGVVVGVAVRGSRLYYQRIPPSAESLSIFYYAKPTAMTLVSSTPDAFPDESFSERLLVNFAAKEIFGEIEQGDEPGVKTNRHERLYLEALAELAAYLGPEEREPVDIPDEMNWDAYLE